MATVFLGLGSNLGDKEANIHGALDRLSHSPDIRVERVSSLYESAPIGRVDQPNFINAAAVIETDLSPAHLLHALQVIEREMGRVHTIQWGPRVIDIDILLYDDAAIETPELSIPHPHMTERAFVMVPLAEVAPDLKLPDGRTPQEDLKKLSNQQVRRIAEEE